MTTATKTKLTIGSYVGWAEPKSNVGANDEYCIVCGKKMGKNGFYVHLSIDGTILDSTKSSEEYGSKSQGYWGVGSECAKKFDSAFLVKMER